MRGKQIQRRQSGREQGGAGGGGGGDKEDNDKKIRLETYKKMSILGQGFGDGAAGGCGGDQSRSAGGPESGRLTEFRGRSLRTERWRTTCSRGPRARRRGRCRGPCGPCSTPPGPEEAPGEARRLKCSSVEDERNTHEMSFNVRIAAACHQSIPYSDGENVGK